MFKKLLTFLILSTLTVLLFGCGQQTTQNQVQDTAKKDGQIVIRVASVAARGWCVTEGIHKFADILNEKAQGKIKVQVYDQGSLGGSDREAMEGIQMGNWEMANSSSANMASFSNKFMVCDLPYIFKDRKEAITALRGPLGDELKAQMERLGMKPIMFLDYGFRQFLNNKKPVKVPDDIKGLKVRTTNSPIEVADFTAFGANPTPIAWGEVYTALQQKTVDGEGNTYDLLYPSKHHEVLKHGTEISYNYSFHAVGMNKKFFDNLSPENKELIMQAAKEAEDWEYKISQEWFDRDRQKFIDSGVQIYTPTPEEMKLWQQAAQKVWDEFVVPGKADPDLVDKTLKSLGKSKADIFN